MSTTYRNSDLDTEGWEYAWQERQPEIDNKIVAFMEDAREQSVDTLNKLGNELGDWFESQQLPEKANAEWMKVRADGKVLQARIEQRIAHLVADGRLRVAQWKREQRG